MPAGKIFLIPSFLGEDNLAIIPDQVKECVQNLNEFIVEDARTARRYLRAIGFKKNFDTEVTIYELDKHAKHQDSSKMLQNVLAGGDIGIISEAGNPCIADPGSEVVDYAHALNIDVVPLVGPSSILLALISSGFNGQQFTFNGYLPIKEPERTSKLKKMASWSTATTQIFMETPFRNQKLFDEIIKTCPEDIKLCVACDLTLPTQYIRTKKIAAWKNEKVDLHKRYCMFLLGV
ncbi:MAG TPA: SAM-dependent methyltransferase [Chitinophagales bacterium]|nr:SAM-dependent methyltransferase [Chitinophagales bacterium]